LVVRAAVDFEFDFALRGSMPEPVPQFGTGSAATQANAKRERQNRKSKDPPFAEPAKDGAPTSKAKAKAKATATTTAGGHKARRYKIKSTPESKTESQKTPIFSPL
jgi:hypothetical protein